MSDLFHSFFHVDIVTCIYSKRTQVQFKTKLKQQIHTILWLKQGKG